MINLLIETKW